MRRSRLLPILALLPALAMTPIQVRAGVNVTIDPGPGASFAAQAGVDLAALQAQLSAEIDKLYQASEARKYVDGFGNAQAFTTRGMGVDYASNMKYLMIGAAANLSLNVEKGYVPQDTRSPPPIEGAGSNATIMAGTNLRWLGLRPISIFANYFQSSGAHGTFDAKLHNWGVHAQLKLFGPKDDETAWNVLMRWGGIDITSGVDFSQLNLELGVGKHVKSDIPLGAAGNAHVLVNSTGKFALDMSTLSVPLEVTTNFRVLYIASVYGGVGFDWQFGGENKIALDLDGKMTGTVAGMSADIGTVKATAAERGVPVAGKLRGLVGAQVNLWLLKLFTQVNVMPDAGLFSLALGVRLVY